MKPKQIQRFDDNTAKSICRVFDSMLTIDIHTKSLASWFIIKMGNHLMIFCGLSKKKQGVIIYLMNNSFDFWLNYCVYIGATFAIILSLSSSFIKRVVIKIEKNITS